MIYLLTPTGDRPECLALLSHCIAAQNYSEPLIWIVVDDGEIPTKTPSGSWNLKVVSIRPNRKDGEAAGSQAANMLEGLDVIPDDATVLVFEDDDVYLPNHVTRTIEALEEVELTGERNARYYNVAAGRYKELQGSRHSAMASIGVRGEALMTLREVCATQTKMLDVSLWRKFSGKKSLRNDSNVIGMKGMPGRSGIGVGHRSRFGTPDRKGVLEAWVGESLAKVYREFREAS